MYLHASLYMPVFENRQVDVREFAADFGEMLPVTAVAAHVDFPRGRLQQERSPERLVGSQPASREVARGEAADGEAVAERSLLVQSSSTIRSFGKPQYSKCSPTPSGQTTVPMRGLSAMTVRRSEVVPMVVGDDQAVDVWHVLRTVEVRAPERAVEEERGAALKKTGSTSTRRPSVCIR